MAQFFTPTGLQLLQGFESSGNPTAQNPSSSASGLYGFLKGTWQQYAPQAGVDTSIFPTAKSAPADVQTQVAAVTPVSNWTCPGCDPGITNAIANDPSLVASVPLAAASNGGGGSVDFSFTPSDPSSTGVGTSDQFLRQLDAVERAKRNNGD